MSKTCCFRYIVLLYICSSSGNFAFSQNLLRNPSFEDGNANKPIDLNQIQGGCSNWNRHNDAFSGGYQDSPDWFEATPGKLRGSVSCGLLGTNSQNAGPFVPPDHGTHFAGIVKEHDNQFGEGIQQRLSQKLDFGYYDLEFDYLLPCDTFEYGVAVYLGKTANHRDFFVGEISLPTQNIGIWQHQSLRFFIPYKMDRQLDWFIFLAEGSSPVYLTLRLGAYIFIDNFDFRKSPCTSCDPNGLISWNWTSPRPYLSPNGDGTFDEWCLTNINNVSWYDILIVDRWGVTVHEEIASNPNGYENLSLCWDGRNMNGQLLQIPNYYVAAVRLGNCGSQITRWYNLWTTHDLGQDTFSVAPNYVPPLFGLEPPPTHYRNLHLYGGPYYGTHDWYACDSIFVGESGGPRVPYFIAGSTANLGFYSTDGTFMNPGNVDFLPGADVDIVPQPIQCCPALRMANPNLPQPMTDDSEATNATAEVIADEEESPMNATVEEADSTSFAAMSIDALTLTAQPNPADGTVLLNLHVPAGETAALSLWTATGTRLMDIGNPHSFRAGDHQVELMTQQLPAGLYFVRGQASGEGLFVRLMIVH